MQELIIIEEPQEEKKKSKGEIRGPCQFFVSGNEEFSFFQSLPLTLRTDTEHESWKGDHHGHYANCH